MDRPPNETTPTGSDPGGRDVTTDLWKGSDNLDAADATPSASNNQLLLPGKTTVKRQVLDHLKSAPLTPGDAWIRYGTSRLAACIHSLRRDGHDIRAETVEVTCRDGRLARVARYSLP
jgi:hypothetical protein